MRIILTVVLIVVSFLACYVEDIYLCLLPLQKGTAIPFTIRVRHSFNFDREKAFRKQKAAALSKYVPLYTHVPDRTEQAAEEVQAVLDEITYLSLQKSNGTKEFRAFVKAGYGFDVSEEVAKNLLRFRDLKNILNGVVTLEESILKGKIIADPQLIAGKKIYEVLYPKPSGIVTFPAADVITLDAARATLQEKVRQLFWQVDKGVRDVIIAIALTTLRPNLIYDAEENNKRVEEIISRYPSTAVPFQAGHILVPFRHELSENDLPLLTAYREEAEKDLFAKAPWVFMTILLTALLYSLVLEKIIKDELRKDLPYPLFISLLTMTVFLMKACLLLTTLPLLALPFGALPLMLVLVQRDKVSATWTVLTAALLVSLSFGYELNVLLFFSFSAIVAVIIALRIRKKRHVLFGSLAIGGANAFLFLCFWPDWGALLCPSSRPWILRLVEVFDHQSLGTLGWTFVGGVAAGPLALLLLPLLETAWHTASTFRLSRYADLQHPLLKELLTKTPATYQHTMSVAYLAQLVGEAVGADPLLLRIGTYYHDIGKVANPSFFAENQSWKNPHDDLDPRESAQIIINHVRDGEKIGRRMKLPQVILDFVIQHHGTQTVESFYTKAVKHNRGGRVLRKEFQYPGPKPQSVEAAIVMICDAVEAASRSLETPTRGAIENMVRLLLVKRINDGQFDECQLSTGCLAQILQILVNSLEASLHSRVVYPWQEKQKEKIKVLAKAASA